MYRVARLLVNTRQGVGFTLYAWISRIWSVTVLQMLVKTELSWSGINHADALFSQEKMKAGQRTFWQSASLK